MKIIFLDIDGVLNSRAYDRKRNWNEQTDIDETRLPLIKEIVDATGAKIVLSSTWRQHWNKDLNRCDIDGRYINKTFAKFGLAIYDKTPDLGIHALRRDEIGKWLKETEQKIEAFVIIDDYRYGWGDLSEHFVKTDPNFRLGIEKEQVEQAIEILNKTELSRSGKMIFITGDTHKTDLLCIHHFCDNHPELTKDDYIIIAGDFGGVWAKETLERDLKPFSDLPVTVLFVDGNHENFDLLETFPVEQWNGGKVHKIKPDIIHLMRGQVFEIEGKTIFTFGGATSIDRDYRVEGESWWAQELPTYEELDEGLANLKRYGNKVDYIITHSCGQRALMYPQIRIVAGIKTICPESHLLSNFEDIVQFRHWYFGHFHIDAELSDKYTVLLHNILGLE